MYGVRQSIEFWKFFNLLKTLPSSNHFSKMMSSKAMTHFPHLWLVVPILLWIDILYPQKSRKRDYFNINLNEENVLKFSTELWRNQHFQNTSEYVQNTLNLKCQKHRVRNPIFAVTFWEYHWSTRKSMLKYFWRIWWELHFRSVCDSMISSSLYDWSRYFIQYV